MIAAQCGYADVVRHLLDNGANINLHMKVINKQNARSFVTFVVSSKGVSCQPLPYKKKKLKCRCASVQVSTALSCTLMKNAEYRSNPGAERINPLAV